MGTTIDAIMALLVLVNLLLIATSHVTLAVRAVAVQGLLLATLPPLVEGSFYSVRALGFAAIIIALKTFLIPSLLRRSIRIAKVDVDLRPSLGYTISLIVAAVAFVLCRLLSAKLPWPLPMMSQLMVPVAFFTIFVGLYLIVTRHQAISQVIGYLQLEYGIFIFGMAHPYERSFLVEIAVILDLFVAVMVMGIAIYHIKGEFDHIDTARLSVLRDFRR